MRKNFNLFCTFTLLSVTYFGFIIDVNKIYQQMCINVFRIVHNPFFDHNNFSQKILLTLSGKQRNALSKLPGRDLRMISQAQDALVCHSL